ncbi:hypothetical protein IPL85_01140 [Candidatus Saccharibacteria bacterium]|nr:MAG: hypothetical protein IPL85_01140 [Candidatus Saccharibacteria bacterium]
MAGAIFLLCPSRAGAQAGSVKTGLTVSPAQISLTVNRQKPGTEASVTITNNYASTVRLAAELRSIDESSARLVPTSPLTGSFAKALSISNTDLTIPAHGQVQLQLVVNGTQPLAPGGHYANLVITEQGAARAALAFRPAVAVSVFVVNAEGLRTNLELQKLQAKHSPFGLPRSVDLTFRNSGNAHVVPRASVSFYSTNGQQLFARAVVNTESRLLFPRQKATYSAPVQAVLHTWFPKHIRMQTMYRIDGSDVELIKQQTFWYVPFVDVLFLGVIVLLVWWQRAHLKHIPYRKMVVRLAKALRWPFKRGKRVYFRFFKRTSDGTARPRKLGGAALYAHHEATKARARKSAAKMIVKHIAEKGTAHAPRSIPVKVTKDLKPVKKTSSKASTKPTSQKKTAAPRKGASTKKTVKRTTARKTPRKA